MSKAFVAIWVSLLRWLPVAIARTCLDYFVSKHPLQKSAGVEKQLLIDVSVIINNDARTGIQRVVRALLLQLLQQAPAGCRVRPVFASRKHGYRYAPDLWSGEAIVLDHAIPVNVGPGDIFLGLDLAAHLLPLHMAELVQWKRLGAEIHIIVYDLLPVLHPQWFNPRTTRNFYRWLRVIAICADSAICISNTVKTELDSWLPLQSGQLPISTIPLGADIQSSAPSRGLPHDLDQLLNILVNKPSILIVGTLEPRKGHSQVLAAFEVLWQQGHDINLMIVGKAGWKTEALQQILREHPQSQVHWLDQASDELLELLYARCQGVIVASHAEGFGLPLIEALRHNKPVLARDIPVFREVGGNLLTFFKGDSTEGFTQDLEQWLNNISTQPVVYDLTQYTWQSSAYTLLTKLGVTPIALNLPCKGHTPQLTTEEELVA